MLINVHISIPRYFCIWGAGSRTLSPCVWCIDEHQNTETDLSVTSVISGITAGRCVTVSRSLAGLERRPSVPAGRGGGERFSSDPSSELKLHLRVHSMNQWSYLKYFLHRRHCQAILTQIGNLWQNRIRTVEEKADRSTALINRPHGDRGPPCPLTFNRCDVSSCCGQRRIVWLCVYVVVSVISII